MRAAVALLLVALAVACAPAFEPAPGSLDGVTLTATQHPEWITFRVDTAQPLDRVFLRFVGENLNANAAECEVVNAALECVIGGVLAYYEVSVAGAITNDWALPAGVACRLDACHAIYLTP